MGSARSARPLRARRSPPPARRPAAPLLPTREALLDEAAAALHPGEAEAAQAGHGGDGAGHGRRHGAGDGPVRGDADHAAGRQAQVDAVRPRLLEGRGDGREGARQRGVGRAAAGAAQEGRAVGAPGGRRRRRRRRRRRGKKRRERRGRGLRALPRSAGRREASGAGPGPALRREGAARGSCPFVRPLSAPRPLLPARPGRGPFKLVYGRAGPRPPPGSGRCQCPGVGRGGGRKVAGGRGEPRLRAV